MQRIDIDDIVNDLKKSSEWKNYEILLDAKKKVFGISFSLNHLNSKEGIFKGIKLDLQKNPKKEADILKEDFWKWTQRENNFESFKKLELKFVELFNSRIKFCPYCGKIPLIRYENDKREKKGTFHLDHIFPKSKYRYLTYNFYNLIPACSTCNQFKGVKNMFLKGDGLFHPYFGWFYTKGGKVLSRDTTFDEELLLTDNSKDIVYSSPHFNFFSLNKIYPNAQDTTNDIFFIRESTEKILATKKLFPKGKTDQDFKNFFFKNYSPEGEGDILKFANGKLKKDMIKKIDLN